MLTLQNAFGGLFALAILELEGAHGLEGWRWLFIVYVKLQGLHQEGL